RLLTETCFNETRAANKYEGHDALGTAFRQLAGIPVQEMMKDPAVAKGIATYGKYLDPKRLEKVFEDTKSPQ
ncbi:MAG: hypothetical protein M3N23_03965, partial [Pseudomonadota bacterium]|nr:hypothetical protein [Pseudomonadota bacterium]